MILKILLDSWELHWGWMSSPSPRSDIIWHHNFAWGRYHKNFSISIFNNINLKFKTRYQKNIFYSWLLFRMCNNLPLAYKVFINLRIEGDGPSSKVDPTDHSTDNRKSFRMFNCYADVGFVITKTTIYYYQSTLISITIGYSIRNYYLTLIILQKVHFIFY